MDSRARECENPAYFVILARNCDLADDPAKYREVAHFC